MKKDIEWLKEKVQYRIDKLPRSYGGLYFEGLRDAYRFALQDLDQLDGAKVLSQEITYEDAIKVIAENIDTDEFSIGLYLEALSNNEKYEFLTEKWIESNTSPVDDEGRLYVWKRDLQNAIVPKQEITFEQAHDKLREESILSERSFDYYWNCINDNVEIDEPGNLLVPKQDERTQLETAYKDILSRREFWFDDKKYVVIEKPVIPQFVADFISDREDWPLYELFDDEWLYREYDQIAKWLYDNDEHTNREREADLVFARRNVFTVEVEQKYYVINNDHRMMLVRMMDGKTITEADPFKLEDMYEAEKKSHRLTEQEIKDYDERYIPFMVPVDEVNND